MIKKLLSFCLPLLVISLSAQQSTGVLGTPGACGKPVSNATEYRISSNETPQDGNGTLGNIYSNTACGLNYATASQKIGQRFTPAGVPQPAPFTISGISPCATIVKAFLWAEGSGNGAAQTATVNGPLGSANYPMTIVGQGPDKCWSYSGSYTYRADVTASVNGNGTYNISGLLINSPNDMDGATLVVIYTDPSQTYQGTIIIDDGAIVIGGGTANYTMNYPAVCGVASNASAFGGIGDIQMPVQSVTLNGTNDPIVFNWWNFEQVNTTVIVGQTSSAFVVASSGDCFNLCIAGLYYQTGCAVCNPQSTLSATGTSTPDQCAACNGTASVSVTPAGTYTYSWAPSGGTGSTATGLCAGTYTVTVASPCDTVTVTITVAGGPGFTTSSVNTNPTCFNGNNGSITVTPTGGTAPFTYAWSPNVGTTQTVNNLSAGTYSCTVTDANGCSTIQVVTITSPPAIAATPSSTSPLCYGDVNGTATVTASGGTPGYTYSWFPVGGTGSTTTALAAGNYTCTITDANGCTFTQSVAITQPNPVGLLVSSDSTCPLFLTPIDATAGGGVGPYSYAWSNGATTSSINVYPTSDTTFTVTVTDANGCSTTGVSNITLFPVPNAVFSTNAINGFFAIGNGDLCAIDNTNGGFSWAWNFNSSNYFTTQNPCITLTSADTGYYCITLMVGNIYGCIDTTYTCFDVSDIAYSIPNVFTPNGDMNNDVFFITNRGMKDLHCDIYDRWGELIYHWDGTTGGWNGKTDSGGEAVDGVYYYVAYLTDVTEKTYDAHGFIQLIRGK